MRHSVSVALIVMGGLVILAPILAAAYTHAANQQRVAEFYDHNSPSVELPQAMQPVGSGSYAWACWLVGVGMVVTGVRVREPAIQPPSA